MNEKMSVFQMLDELLAPCPGAVPREAEATLALALEKAGLKPREDPGTEKKSVKKRLSPGLLAAAALLALGSITAVAAHQGISGLFQGIFQEQRSGRAVPLSGENPLLEETGQRLDLTAEDGNIRVLLAALAGDRDRGSLVLEVGTLDGSPLGEGPLSFGELEAADGAGVERLASVHDVEEQSRPAPDRAVLVLSLYEDLGPGETVSLTFRDLVRREAGPEGDDDTALLAAGKWSFSFQTALGDAGRESAPGVEVEFMNSTLLVKRVEITPYMVTLWSEYTAGPMVGADAEAVREISQNVPPESRRLTLTDKDGEEISLWFISSGGNGEEDGIRFQPQGKVLIRPDAAASLTLGGTTFFLED